MAKRKNYPSGARWENIVGYSRAVSFGNQLEISGTVATDEAGNVVGADDAGAQTRFILEKIKRIVTEAGFALSDIVRTRMFVTDISKWEAVGRVHGEFFKDIKPVTSMVEVSALTSPEKRMSISAKISMT
jgi:enamine deaminase RidA (YjgF/YER057c/UK114 family)